MKAPAARARIVLTTVAVVLFAIVAVLSARAALQMSSVDFRAFYCAGTALGAGGDPYRVEPLRSCEHDATYARGIIAGIPGSVLPAPLPGYDLAAMELLARMPYHAAALLWQVLLWSAVAAAIVALWQLTGLRLPVVVGALLFSDGYINSFVGQLAPFAIGGVALAAWAVSRRRPALASVFAAFALCEPHVGLAPFLALLILVPAARISAVCALGALALATYSATGVRLTIEYLRDVLPLHVVAEIRHQGQYSLTSVLHLLRAPDGVAVFAGDVSYLVAVVAGIFLAARLRMKLRDTAVVLAVPAALSLIGGPFMHLSQMAAALPAALLLYARVPRARRALGVAVVLLAIPWTAFVQLLAVAPYEAAAVAVLTIALTGNVRVAAAVTAAQFVVLLIAATLFQFEVPALHVIAAPWAFSEDAWRTVVNGLYTQNVGFFFLLKLPTWCGLVIVAWVSLRVNVARAKFAEIPSID